MASASLLIRLNGSKRFVERAALHVGCRGFKRDCTKARRSKHSLFALWLRVWSTNSDVGPNGSPEIYASIVVMVRAGHYMSAHWPVHVL